MIERNPNVKGVCPSCGNKTLFLGEGGYVTCSMIGCMNPGAASDLLEKPTAKDYQESVIANYREVRERMLAFTKSSFPANSRVAPVGCTSPSWFGTVRQVGEYERLDLSADMVAVNWDNGNEHPAKIDEIELI